MLTKKEAAKRLANNIKEQKTSYSVIVDGNTHKLPVRIRTKKETITIKKCKEIIAAVQGEFDINIKRIEIYMDEWDYEGITIDTYIGAIYNDCDIPRKLIKKAIYNNGKNRLQIWQNGEPVYENYNGIITRDRDALADCLL